MTNPIDTPANTYFARACAEDDEGGGRFAVAAPTTTVVGAVPTVPMLPAGSPWAGGPGPGDEPLIEGSLPTYGVDCSGAGGRKEGDDGEAA